MDYENTSKPLTQRQLKVGETLKKLLLIFLLKIRLFYLKYHLVLLQSLKLE